MSNNSAMPAPLQIDEIRTGPFGGVIGLTLCPGHSGRPDLIDRDLKSDLAAILAWEAAAILTLMEAHEFTAIAVPELPCAMQELAIPWYHLPIRDTDIPDERFEDQWRIMAPALIDVLMNGKKILIHCRGGLGRSGTIAARILIELGYPPVQAVKTVRESRLGAIENALQEAYVLALQPSLNLAAE